MSPSTKGRFSRGGTSATPKAAKASGTSRAGASAAPKDPGSMGRVAQMRQAYGYAKQIDPKITQWMVGAAVLVFLVCLGIGFLVGHPVLWGITGLFLAALAAAVVMSRRADRGAYAMIEGKPGAALAALSSIRRGGWYIAQEPVAFEGRPVGQDMSSVATVYRAVGKPGVVLVAEGPTGRAKKLLAAEQKKVERFAPGAPVHLMRVGEGDDTVPARKLAWQVQKLKPVLTQDEVTTVEKRLKAMQNVRTGVPAGMDPSRARSSRAQLRGR